MCIHPCSLYSETFSHIVLNSSFPADEKAVDVLQGSDGNHDVANAAVILTGQLIQAGLYSIEVRPLPISREHRACDEMCGSIVFRLRL